MSEMPAPLAATTPTAAPRSLWIRLLAAARPHVLVVFLGLAVVALVLAYSQPSGQSFLVEARTYGATVSFQGSDGAWRLPPLTLCEPRPRPDLAQRGSGAGVCDPALFVTRSFEAPVEFAIPAGTKVEVRARADGTVTMQMPEGAEPVWLGSDAAWGPGGVLVIAADAWRDAGALVFDGRVVIGADIISGEPAFLIEGHYQIRERLLRQRLFGRTRPVEVASGELLRGDRVEFRAARASTDAAALDAEEAADAAPPRVDGANPAAVLARGFIAPAPDEADGFLITAASDPDLTGADFVVRSFGARETLISPTWTDRATRDPLLIAAAAVLGFLTGLVGLFLQIYGHEDEDEQEAE